MCVAFDTHFGSKTDAFRIAIHEGFDFFQRGIAAIREKAGENWLPALVDFYFVDRMEVGLGEACVLTGLTADAMRADDETRQTYEAELQKLAAALAEASQLRQFCVSAALVPGSQASPHSFMAFKMGSRDLPFFVSS